MCACVYHVQCAQYYRELTVMQRSTRFDTRFLERVCAKIIITQLQIRAYLVASDGDASIWIN